MKLSFQKTSIPFYSRNKYEKLVMNYQLIISVDYCKQNNYALCVISFSFNAQGKIFPVRTKFIGFEAIIDAYSHRR